MKPLGILALAASTAAWVLPDQQVFIDLKDNSGKGGSQHSYMDEFKNELGSAMQAVANEFEDAVDEASKFDPQSAFGKVIEDIEVGAYGDKHDKTAYQVIAESGHADKFVKLLDEFEDVRDLLNSSDAEVTVFVPTDKAFEKIPDHDDKDKDKKPPKWFLEALIKSHVVRGSYTARQIFGVHTLPTLLDGDHLSEDGSKTPQRLSVKVGWRGIYLNNYNRVVHRDFKANNGIVHGVHNFNLPPPPLPVIVSVLPTVFSTFELGLHKSGLGHVGHHAHRGATVFAPANGAWRKLGWKANAFLFSHWGRKYLKGLLAYHLVANQTLYSDAYYSESSDDGDASGQSRPKKGRFHIDLPTLLPDQHLGVDVGRYGRFIDMHVNHYSKVVFQDAIAHDGVIHVVDHVLMPYHKKHGPPRAGEITIQELKDRLEPFVQQDDCDDDGAEPEHDKHYPLVPQWGNLEL